MPKQPITITISGKENIRWLRRKVAEGNYLTEAEAVNDSVAILREEEEFVERGLKKHLVANTDSQGRYCGPILSIEEVERHLEESRQQRLAT